MPEINLSDSRKRDAVVKAVGTRVRERLRWVELRKGFFNWIPLDCRSLRSPRLCVSKKILGTGKRRGAEERGGCAVGEKDWRGGGWDGRSSGRDFLFGFLSIVDRCALRVSAFQRRSWGPLNAEAQRNAEGARSETKIEGGADGMGGVQEGSFYLDSSRLQIAVLYAYQSFKEDPGDR